MAYNSENLLKRIIQIQEITLEHTRRGITQRWVWENIIFPRFLVSASTYYKYLSRNAKKELKALNDLARKH